MSATDTVTVALPAKLVAQVREALAAGDALSNDEVVSDALLNWSEHHGHDAEDTRFLREAWRQAEQDTRPRLSHEQVFSPVKEKLRAKIQTAEK